MGPDREVVRVLCGILSAASGFTLSPLAGCRGRSRQHFIKGYRQNKVIAGSRTYMTGEPTPPQLAVSNLIGTVPKLDQLQVWDGVLGY
jgi:hypothetical protein